MARTFIIDKRTVYAGLVAAHALTKGDQIVYPEGDKPELHYVAANPAHQADPGKVIVRVNDSRTPQLFELNEPVWRVYGARAGAVGTR